MNRLFLVLLFFVTGNAYSDNGKSVNLSFDRVPIIEFVNLIYGDILKQNFALDPAIVAKAETVTVHFQNDMDKVKVESYVKTLLESVGVAVKKMPGYVLIKPLDKSDKDIDEEIFCYRPRYRSVAYLKGLVSGFFGKQQLSLQSQNTRGAIVPRDAVRQDSLPIVNQPAALPPSSSQLGGAASSEADVFVYQGSQREIERLGKLLAQVDTPSGEVIVKGVVYEVSASTSDKTAIGLAVSLISGHLNIVGGVASSLGNAVTFNKSVAAGGLDAIYSALSVDSRFRALSSPVLRAVSGDTARFSAGADVPVQGIATLDKNGNMITSTEYKPSGVILDISPRILGEVINLRVRQQLSNFVQTTTGVNSSPTLLKREISTSVGAQDGDIIILGGLAEEKTSDDSNGLSFLPDWLRSAGKTSSKTEVVLVLQVNKI